MDAKTDESIAVATVNLPHECLGPGQVFIKDHSENRGMLETLEKAGIVKATGETVQSGFVQVPKAILLGEFRKSLEGITECLAAEMTKNQDREI